MTPIAFSELPTHAGRVVRFSHDGGEHWTYSKLRTFPGGFCPYSTSHSFSITGCLGVPADAEISESGVHHVAPVLDHFYDNSRFRIELVSEEDAANRRFSYGG